MVNIIKRTEIAQNYLRNNVTLNLLDRNWKLILANKDCFICSLRLDLNYKEIYFVFLFDEMDNITKIGEGFLEGDTIKLKERKLEWLI